MPMETTVLNPGVIGLLEKDLQAMARDFGSRGRLRKPFERIRDEVMIPSIEKNFEVGGRPKWEPLSPSTTGLSKGEFIASGGSGPIGGRVPLTKTGQMRRAATAKARFHISGNEMTYGNFPEKRWFARVHDLASLAAKAQVPHRPFVLIQPEDVVATEEIMLEWIEEIVNDNIKLRYV